MQAFRNGAFRRMSVHHRLIAIHAAARGKGLGLGLIRTMEASIPAGEMIRVSTQLDNLGSRAMYEKAGFEVCATNRVYHRHDG